MTGEIRMISKSLSSPPVKIHSPKTLLDIDQKSPKVIVVRADVSKILKTDCRVFIVKLVDIDQRRKVKGLELRDSDMWPMELPQEIKERGPCQCAIIQIMLKTIYDTCSSKSRV